MGSVLAGTTMHIDFALPVDHNLTEGFRVWREKASHSRPRHYLPAGLPVTQPRL